MAHASFGHDTAIYYQAWYLIAHGHLLPRNSIQGGYYFWQNDGEFIVYLLAPLYWLFPNHLLGLLWLQDLALSGTIAVCYKFVCDRWVSPRLPGSHNRGFLAGLAVWLTILVLLLCDPWIYWVVSFDIHMEVFGVFFIACALFVLEKHQRRGYLYALLAALCGTASVVYVFSLGLVVAVQSVGRWYLTRRKDGGFSGTKQIRAGAVVVATPGALLIVASVLWLYALSALHATKGTPTGGYLYLLGPTGARVLRVTFGTVVRSLFEHPLTALRTLASHGWNPWANTSGAGFVGLLTPVGFFMAVPTLLVDGLVKGQESNYPTFQALPAFIFIALGSAVLLAYLIKRPKTFFVGLIVFVLVIVNELGWFLVWFPKTRVHWMETSAAAASVIWRTERAIPAGDEVVITNGVAGPFGGHVDLYEFAGPSPIPIRDHVVWFVLSPAQGIEIVPTAVMERALGDIAELPGAKLITASQGVYVFRWRAPSRYRSISLGRGDELQAWTAPGVAGMPVFAGPASRWHLTADGQTGYVLSGDFWREPHGSYSANIRYSSTGPINMEVWDDTTNRLLARVRAGRSSIVSNVRLSFELSWEKPGFVYQGAGIFRDLPVPQIPGDEIEVRVWTAGTARVGIWSVALERN